MRKLLLSSLALIPGLALAQGEESYRCTQGGLVRRVEIVHAEGAQVPCSVNYHKDTEAPGQSEELWNAQNDPTYCEQKAREFVAKLESLGWQCGAADRRESVQ